MYNGGGSRADYYYHRTPSFDPTEDTIILNPPLLKRGTLRCLFQTVDKTLLVSTPEAFFLFSVQKVCT